MALSSLRASRRVWNLHSQLPFTEHLLDTRFMHSDHFNLRVKKLSDIDEITATVQRNKDSDTNHSENTKTQVFLNPSSIF